MRHSEIEISLTQFVDFVLKTGTTRLTQVRQIKSQKKTGYHPSHDFYRKLREGIVEYHESELEKSYLDSLARNITDKNKTSIYPELIKAYKKFIGRKDITWFDPIKDCWDYKVLRVSVNPELGIEYNGNRYLVKLYFKEDPKLTKSRVSIISNLMDTLDRPDDIQLALLDVRRGKLHDLSQTDQSLQPLLEGEADAFITMYNGVKI